MYLPRTFAREPAAAARRAILDGPAGPAAGGAWTVARWLLTGSRLQACFGLDRLAALWWLIALRGLRRGEAAALDRSCTRSACAAAAAAAAAARCSAGSPASSLRPHRVQQAPVNEEGPAS
jgi:hypothetical protein